MKPYLLYNHPNITNFQQLIDRNAEVAPTNDAFRYLTGKEIISVTYTQFRTDINALGAFFLHKGLQNAKIAVIGKNSYHWLLTYFATVMSGNVIVPIDKELPEKDIAELLVRCGAAALVYSDTYSDIGAAMLEGKCVTAAFNMKDFSQYIQAGGHHLETGESTPPQIAVDENAVCSIIFTSGTTGKPKGVMLTQRSLLTDAVSSCRNVHFSGPGLLTLPLHHTFAFTATVLVLMVYGLPICISRSIRTLTADIQTFKPQSIALVPLYIETIYNGIWKTAKAQGKDKLLKTMLGISGFSRKLGIDLRRKLFQSVLRQFGGELDLLICGGAPLKQFYIDGMDALGIQVLNGYGITECSPVVSVNRNRHYRSGSIGLPLECCEVKIQDGEICVKGDLVMAGYYKDEAATKKVLTDGWFHTGDLGYLDKDGFLFITGRKKNLIILSNGKNVAPEELEEKLLDIAGVKEVVVYVQDNLITAEIFADDKDGIGESVATLNRELPGYKRIQKVKFRDSEFEKTTTKKIRR